VAKVQATAGENGEKVNFVFENKLQKIKNHFNIIKT